MKKTMPSTILVAAVALAMAASSLPAAERYRPGQWEYTTTHDARKNEPRTFKHCVSEEDAGSANGDTKSARAHAEKAAGAGCKVIDYKVAGDTVSYSIQCAEVSIRSTMTFHGDTSEGEMITKHAGSPEDVSHIKARRLGDCPASHS